MRRSINRIVLVGNVGRDSDVHTSSPGTRVAHVSLATRRRVSHYSILGTCCHHSSFPLSYLPNHTEPV